MGDPTIIPAEQRADLCRLALDAQAGCLAAFDAIESGDLARTVLALTEATSKVRELNEQVRPFAMNALLRSNLLTREVVAHSEASHG